MFGHALGAWVRARQEAAYQNQYEKGFGWAMTARYLHKQPIEYIDDCVMNGILADGENAFDKGAAEAVRMMDIATEKHKLTAAKVHKLESVPIPPRRETLADTVTLL